MKELNFVEIQEVSGGGAIADAFAELGKGFGSIVEASGVKGATDIGTQMGAGIGAIVESAIDILGKLFGRN